MTSDMSIFVGALKKTLHTMANLEPKTGMFTKGSVCELRADVSAHLSLISDQERTLVITLSEGAAIRLVQIIAGLEVSFDDPLVGDTAGELLNVIAGSAQRETRYQFSIPVVAKGKAHEVKVLRGRQLESVISEIPGGTIALHLIEHEDRA